jgi:NSS family neurotransmitter:Na+ symporter
MASRGGFSSKIGFIAAAAGSAVGLGNIWKFPFEVANGGGAAFVVIYLAFCFILCFPVMVAEIAIGRKTQKNPSGAFAALGFPKWSFVGKLGIIAGILILSFYNVVAGWAFGYVIEMFMGRFEVAANFGDYIANVVKIGSYAIVFMAVTAFIVSKGVSAGIEKLSTILMPTLIIMIVGLAIYAMTLPHAMDGLKFYLIPDFSQLTPKVMYAALGQAFFSLSLGMGALITYGSYVSKNDNIISSAALITLTDVGIAVLAGLMMFPFVAFKHSGDLASIEGGAGFIFTTLPAAFESIGAGGAIVGGLFFLLLSFAALTSTVSLLEVPVAYVVDEHGVKRKRAVIGVALLVFIIGIPSLLGNGYLEFLTKFISWYEDQELVSKTFMDFVEVLASDTFLPLGGFMISFFVGWIWKKANLDEELAQGNPNYKGSFVQKYLNFAITYLAPTVLGILFLLTVLSKTIGFELFG